MKYLLILAAALCVISCEEPNDAAPLSRTRDNFESPSKIGTLPDGRVVKCVVRDRGSAYPHYIYFVDGTVSTSTNTTVSAGKTSYNQVVVEIDGVKYVPVENPEPKK